MVGGAGSGFKREVRKGPPSSTPRAMKFYTCAPFRRPPAQDRGHVQRPGRSPGPHPGHALPTRGNEAWPGVWVSVTRFALAVNRPPRLLCCRGLSCSRDGCGSPASRVARGSCSAFPRSVPSHKALLACEPAEQRSGCVPSRPVGFSPAQHGPAPECCARALLPRG